MKNIKFFPKAYEPSKIEGVDGYFSYEVVEKAGLPHYDNTGNTNKYIKITKEKKDELVYLREKQKKHARRYADLKVPLVIRGWNTFADKYYGISKGLEIKVKIGEKELSLYSRNLQETIARAIYGISYAKLSLLVKSKGMDYEEYSAIDNAFSYYDNFGNRNDLRNEGFIKSIITYLKENEEDICKEFRYKTDSEMKQYEAEMKKKKDAAKIAFENAQPNDLVDSGCGYMVKKRDYAKSINMGYDGIENL